LLAVGLNSKAGISVVKISISGFQGKIFVLDANFDYRYEGNIAQSGPHFALNIQ
jgi:hypothetical protein